jgi:hypothetical protein
VWYLALSIKEINLREKKIIAVRNSIIRNNGKKIYGTIVGLLIFERRNKVMKGSFAKRARPTILAKDPEIALTHPYSLLLQLKDARCVIHI